ncbi:hypothetical protein [Sinomonas sp. G460-2]
MPSSLRLARTFVPTDASKAVVAKGVGATLSVVMSFLRSVT